MKQETTWRDGPNRVIQMELDGRRFTLVGLADHGEESLVHADEVLVDVEPDMVMLELCETRLRVLTDDAFWHNQTVFDALRQGKGLMLLGALAGSVFLSRQAHDLNLRLGAEMVGRLNHAESIGTRWALGERDIHVTLKRSWKSLSRARQARLMLHLLSSLFTRAKVDDDSRPRTLQETLYSALLGYLPEVREPFWEEANQYLAASIREAEGDSIAAVVNLARLDEVARELADDRVDRQALLNIPTRKKPRLRPVFVALLILAGVIWSAARLEHPPWREMLLAWFLPKMAIVGFFALLAGARPVTILAASAIAPFTPLSPAFRMGVIAGLIEGWARKPVVSDCETLHQDLRSLRSLYRNRLTRVLLVSWLTHIAAAISSYVGLFLLYRVLT